jgi:hypothetical protein
MELYFNYKRSCSDVRELRHTPLVHNCHLSVTSEVRLSPTNSESESARRTPGQPVWLSVTKSWAQCGKPATTKWPTWAKWLYMCEWWAAVHTLKLDVTSNLKISTLNLKLGRSDCNKSMRGIQAVAVHLNNSPHWPHNTLAMARPEEVERRLEAGAPSPRHDIGKHIMTSVISHGSDIRSYWYQRALSWLICIDIMSNIIRYGNHRRFHMICIWYRRQYHEK